MRIKVIANLTAGRGGKKAIEKVIEYMKAKGKTYTQADGDVVGQLPAEFSIAEEGITVILPKEV